MRRFFLLAASLVVLACSTPALQAEEVTLETDDQKVLYALGQALSQSISALQFSPDEIAYVQAGLADGAAGVEPRVDMETYGPMIQVAMQTRIAGLTEKEKAAGQAYCDEQAKAEGAERLASGLVFRSLVEGDGASPSPTDKVKVHYHGTLRVGKVFDSSVDRGTPAEFNVGGVIPCFSEALQKMKVGGKAHLTCPADIAYGERGNPPSILPGAAISFDLELLEIVNSAPSKPSIP